VGQWPRPTHFDRVTRTDRRNSNFFIFIEETESDLPHTLGHQHPYGMYPSPSRNRGLRVLEIRLYDRLREHLLQDVGELPFSKYL